MALGNTPRRETTISVEASKSYAFGMHFIDAEEKPLDLTDCEVRLVAAEAPHVGGTEVINIVATSEAPVTGFVQFNFQASDLELEPGSYAYDVTLLPPTGYSQPIIKGYIEIGPNMDLDTSNVYDGLNVGSEITIVGDYANVLEIRIERVDGLYLIVASLIEDFTEAMAIEVAKAAASATAAEDSANLAALANNEMQVWLDNAGFPFWKGTYAQYQALTPKAEVLYLLVDEAVA